MGDMVSPVGSYENHLLEESRKASDRNNVMDKDMFFKMLVTQLQNQDPMNPMEDRDFIAQLAQFTSLEQMTQINEIGLQSYTYGMIGKNIIGTAIDPETKQQVTVMGKVDCAAVIKGEPYFYVGEYLVKGSDISQVFADFDLVPPTDGDNTVPPAEDGADDVPPSMETGED